jgi:hypothetical protein
MTWWQQTVAKCVLFVARLVALAEGQDEIAAELKAISNHITTYRKPVES